MRKANLADLIEAGAISPGTRLGARYKRQDREAIVTSSGRVKMPDKDKEQSLSTAAGSITGHSTNGWTFWRVVVEGKAITLDQLRSRSV